MKQKRAAVVLGYESALWPRVTAHMRFKPWNLLCAEQRLAARDLGIDRMAWPPQPGVDGVMAWRRVLSVRRALRIVFEDAISNEIMEERVGRWRMMRQWCENEETGITHYRSVAPQPRMLNTREVSSFNDYNTNSTRILARKTCILLYSIVFY